MIIMLIIKKFKTKKRLQDTPNEEKNYSCQ